MDNKMKQDLGLQIWAWLKEFFGTGFWQGVGTSIFTFLVVLIYKNFRFFILRFLRTIKFVIKKEKYVIFWNDHDITTSEKIISLLKLQGLKHQFVALASPNELLSYPLSPKMMHMVALIVSDVTKLSEVEEERNLIQLKVVNYVRKGGVLFGFHDIIYKRCRNTALQTAFGCVICNFQRVAYPIHIEVVGENRQHPLLKGIESDFMSDDGEVCWGDWDKSAKILIRTVAEFQSTANTHLSAIQVPMLVVHHTGDLGTLIWSNCADKGDKLANSLNEPQPHIIKILSNSLKYTDEIKQFYQQPFNS